MENLIKYSDSVVIYFTCFLVSVAFAGLAQIFSRREPGISRLTPDKQTRYPNRLWWFLSFLVLFLLAAVRYETGNDFKTYQSLYVTLNEIDTLKLFIEQLPITEPAFILLNFFVKAVFNNSQMVFVVSALIILAFFYHSISQYFEKISVMLAVMIFIVFFFPQSLNILRQIIAVAITFYATGQFIKGRNKPAVLWLLVAVSFHVTALVVLPFWITGGDAVWKRRIRFVMFAMLAGLVLVSMQYRSLLASIPVIGPVMVSAGSTESIGIGLITLRAPIFLPILLFRKRLAEHDRRNHYWMIMLAFELVFSHLGYINEVFSRMALYFSVSWVVLLPSLVRCMPTKNTQRLMGGYVVLLALFFSYFYILNNNVGTILPYHFYFGNPAV